MDQLRKPFFLLALILMTLAVLVEAGSTALVGDAGAEKTADALDAPTPGYGIPYHALLDGLLLFTALLMGAPLVIPERIHGRVQGVATLIVSILALLGSIALILIALAMLLLMIALLLAVPFGTIAYMILYGHFDRSGAQVTLGLILGLKMGFAVFLLLAHQDFVKNKGLMLILATSFLATIVVSFLHGFVPRPLVSITDALGGIVVGIIAAIWAIVYLIGSIPSIVKALRVDRATA